MATSDLEPAPLTFDRFWNWLGQHRSCVVRAGTPEATLFDDDDLHWDFFDEDEASVAQLIRGKRLVGELAFARSTVLFVQASIDIENPQEGHWMFELISGEGKDRIPIAYFVMSHGVDNPPGHQALKH